MVLWAAAHEKTQNQALVEWIRSDKEKFLAEVRKRLADDTPIQPRAKPAP